MWRNSQVFGRRPACLCHCRRSMASGLIVGNGGDQEIGFEVAYYEDGAATARQNKLSPITKSHVVTVDSFNYDIAKASL